MGGCADVLRQHIVVNVPEDPYFSTSTPGAINITVWSPLDRNNQRALPTIASKIANLNKNNLPCACSFQSFYREVHPPKTPKQYQYQF